ncbi:MAG: hypothetical protein C0596_02680 [Marinilabiliales bacterium]|nr:MAG: hypothetical protein C0596_02680 [Marinilabiliales bacterium]
MNKSLKDNSNLKGKRTHYFKLRKGYKTVYSKQSDRNSNKMSPEQFELFKQKLKNEKKRKTIKSLIIIFIFLSVCGLGILYLLSLI